MPVNNDVKLGTGFKALVGLGLVSTVVLAILSCQVSKFHSFMYSTVHNSLKVGHLFIMGDVLCAIGLLAYAILQSPAQSPALPPVPEALPIAATMSTNSLLKKSEETHNQSIEVLSEKILRVNILRTTILNEDCGDPIKLNYFTVTSLSINQTFHSFSELNAFNSSSYENVEIYYENNEISNGLTELERRNIFARIFPSALLSQRIAEGLYNCRSFFKQVFDAQSSLILTCSSDISDVHNLKIDDCHKLVIEPYNGQSGGGLIFCDDEDQMVHFAIHLDKGMTLSELGTSGVSSFATIEELQHLYEANYIMHVRKVPLLAE